MTLQSQHPQRSRQTRAFSLIEVVVALAVVSFALTAIIALLPIGIQSTTDSLRETDAVMVLSSVIADRRSTPLTANSLIYQLPALTPTMGKSPSKFFGVTANHTYTLNLATALYRVDYTIVPPDSGQLTPYQVDFRASWPAQNPNPSSFVDVIVTYQQ